MARVSASEVQQLRKGLLQLANWQTLPDWYSSRDQAENSTCSGSLTGFVCAALTLLLQPIGVLCTLVCVGKWSLLHDGCASGHSALQPGPELQRKPDGGRHISASLSECKGDRD